MPATLSLLDGGKGFASQLAEKIPSHGGRAVFEKMNAFVWSERVYVVKEDGSKQGFLTFVACPEGIEGGKPCGKPLLFDEAVSEKGCGVFDQRGIAADR